MNWPWRKRFDLKPILDRYIDRDFELFACGADAPSLDTVRRFEAAIGFRLPQDFVDFSISPLGGIYIAVKEALWPRPKEFQVGPFWTFLYGMHTMGFGRDIPEWMDIRVQRDAFRAHTSHDVVPFLKVIGDANVYGFSASGDVVQWDHETDELQAIKKSFPEVLEFEISALVERKRKKAAQPGATDNPDDAQRLREDH